MNSIEMSSHYVTQNELNINNMEKIRSSSERSIGSLSLNVRNVSSDRKKSINRLSHPIDNSISPPNYFDLNRVSIETTRKRSHLIEEETHKLKIHGLRKRSEAVDGMVAVLSAFYCKVLVVLGLQIFFIQITYSIDIKIISIFNAKVLS